MPQPHRHRRRQHASSTSPCRRWPPTARGRARRADSQLQWIVDSYVARVRRPAAHRRRPGRPLRPLPGARLGLAVFGVGSALAAVRRRRRPAHRLPGGDGHRRRVHHAGHAVDHHQRVHRSPERGKAIGVWAGVVGARPGPRPGHRRLAARALLVGLGVPRQRADRDRRTGRAATSSCPTRRDPRPPRSTPSAPCCRSSGSPRCCGRIIEAPDQGLELDADRSAPSSAVLALLAAFLVWERHTDAPDARPQLLPRTPVQRRQRRHHARRSSRMFGLLFLLTQYLQSVLGYTPLEGRRRAAAAWRR